MQDKVFFPEEYNAYFFDDAGGKANGVAIYSRQMPKAIMTGLGFADFDMEGRYIQADYENLSVACLLAPRVDPDNASQQARKNEFFELLSAHLQKVRNKRREFIICGNWNIVHSAADVQDSQRNSTVSGFLTEERQWMDELLESGYVDAFREVSSDQDEFTWWPDGERGTNGWRTDFHLISQGLKYGCRLRCHLQDQAVFFSRTRHYGLRYRALVCGRAALIQRLTRLFVRQLIAVSHQTLSPACH